MSFKVKAIIIGVFVVLLGVGGFIAQAMEAKKPGTACETYKKDCSGPGAACLAGSRGGNYCSITCQADDDCPATWRCGGITESTVSGKTGQITEKKTVKMCLKP